MYRRPTTGIMLHKRTEIEPDAIKSRNECVYLPLGDLVDYGKTPITVVVHLTVDKKRNVDKRKNE